MAVTAAEAGNVFFEDQQPSMGDRRLELLAGLQKAQKQINPKYFYDEPGSALFEKITQLQEYYPTRTEIAILDRFAADIADYSGRECVLIEPGSGNSEKVRLLLDAIQPAAYVPLDISADYLYQSALQLGQDFPWLKIHAICADFADSWHARSQLPRGRRVVFYPGSTIGNLEPALARTFLAELGQWIGDDGGVIIGVDLQKPEHLLHAAYNDSEGVTAEFNLNILHSINKLAGADFEPRDFSHRAFYNAAHKRIEMHLVSRVAQTVNINGNTIAIAKDETLHTENSYKYSLESFTALCHGAGFKLEQSWLDEEALFSVNYLSVARR